MWIKNFPQKQNSPPTQSQVPKRPTKTCDYFGRAEETWDLGHCREWRIQAAQTGIDQQPELGNYFK